METQNTDMTDLDLYISSLTMHCRKCLITKSLDQFKNLMTVNLSNYRICLKCQNDEVPYIVHTCTACGAKSTDMGFNVITKKPYKTCEACRAYNRAYKARLRHPKA